MYYEDVTSIGAKYDLANRSNLRGAGIWALGYDDGHTELWDLIGSHVNVSHAPVAHATAPAGPVGTTDVPVAWGIDAGSVPASSYRIWSSQDGGAWTPWIVTTGTSAVFHGFAGHGYGFYAEAFGAGGRGSGAPNGSTPPQVVTQVAATATRARPFTGLYAVDADGSLLAGSSLPLPASATWPGWSIVRGAAMAAGAQGGYVLDGFGGRPSLRLRPHPRHQRLLVGLGHRPRPRHRPRGGWRLHRRRLGRRAPGRQRAAGERQLVLAALGHRPRHHPQRLRPQWPQRLGARRLGRGAPLRRRRAPPRQLVLAGLGHRPGHRQRLHRRPAGRLRARRLGRGAPLRRGAAAGDHHLLAGLGHRPRPRRAARRGRRLRRRRLGRLPPHRQRAAGGRPRLHPGARPGPRRRAELRLRPRNGIEREVAGAASATALVPACGAGPRDHARAGSALGRSPSAAANVAGCASARNWPGCS